MNDQQRSTLARNIALIAKNLAADSEVMAVLTVHRMIVEADSEAPLSPDDLPPWVMSAARQIGDYFASRNIQHWQCLGVCHRDYAHSYEILNEHVHKLGKELETIKESRAVMTEQEQRTRNELNRVRSLLADAVKVLKKHHEWHLQIGVEIIRNETASVPEHLQIKTLIESGALVENDLTEAYSESELSMSTEIVLASAIPPFQPPSPEPKISYGITCDKCGGYVPGHATGAGDICTCEPISK